MIEEAGSPMIFFLTIFMGLIFVYILYCLFRAVQLVPAKQEFIVERLGRYNETLRAGFHLLIPFVDAVRYRQDLKERTVEVGSQTCFTKDEIQINVDGVIYMKVIDSTKASYGITDYKIAAIQLAQTTTRAIIGTLELDRTFKEREMISVQVVSVLNAAAFKWGVQILRFEIKNLTPPDSVREAMEKQVTAERSRRAILQKSIGERERRINTSEGIMTELINRSEGEMQKKINQAEGIASEIVAIGEATAEAIERVSRVLAKEGGEKAIRLELSQKYFNALEKISKKNGRVIIPGDLTNLKGMLSGFNLDL